MCTFMSKLISIIFVNKKGKFEICFLVKKIGRSDFCYFLKIQIAILGHLIQEQFKSDFKFGLAVLELGYMQILVNLAELFLPKITNWHVFFCHPVNNNQQEVNIKHLKINYHYNRLEFTPIHHPRVSTPVPFYSDMNTTFPGFKISRSIFIQTTSILQ